MEQILFLTNITSGAVYIIIFAIMLMVGYMNRATAVYNNALNNGISKYAAFAWFPFTSVITMAKLAKCTFIPALISSILFYATTGVSIAIMIIKGTVILRLIWLCGAMYLLSCICHFFVLKKYMNKFFPDVSTGYIAFASIVPLYKLLIHINF